MKQFNPMAATKDLRQVFTPMRNAFVLLLFLALPELAFAGGDTFGGTSGKACNFLASVRSLLNIASVAVVTIAIVFAGYQIAFAHKRISDVAPILIGGLLIGAASQLAKWIMPNNSQDCVEASTTSFIMDATQQIAQHLDAIAPYVA